MKDARAALERALPYAAEVGRAAYGALAVVIVAYALAEFLSPGIVASVVAPQTLALAAVVAAGLALVAPRPDRPSFARRVLHAAVGVAASVFAFSAAWYYFVPVPDLRAPLAWSAGAIVACMFAAYA
jgi:hypothetical protein